MNKNETKKAERLLKDRTDRTETCGSDAKGGWCLTAHWVDGGQQLFHTLEQVRDYLESRYETKEND
jgi:hypothetical protein